MTEDPATPPSNVRYAGPIRPLLDIGEIALWPSSEWLDYPASYALTDEHVPDLVRMACDFALLNHDEVRLSYAPVHAWRALGQLRAETAVGPLLEFLAADIDDDFVGEDFPKVFGMIGPSALPALYDFVVRPSAADSLAKTVATISLATVGTLHPEARRGSVEALVRLLEGHDKMVNGTAVSALIDLQATEAISAIRQTFARQAVDVTIPGDLEDVEIALKLRTRRTTPRPHYGRLMQKQVRRSADRSPIEQKSGGTRSVKVGRNDPCPCGSGKKFKKCCGDVATVHARLA